jgi:hypothetical protein
MCPDRQRPGHSQMYAGWVRVPSRAGMRRLLPNVKLPPFVHAVMWEFAVLSYLWDLTDRGTAKSGKAALEAGQAGWAFEGAGAVLRCAGAERVANAQVLRVLVVATAARSGTWGRFAADCAGAIWETNPASGTGRAGHGLPTVIEPSAAAASAGRRWWLRRAADSALADLGGFTDAARTAAPVVATTAISAVRGA